MDNGFFALKDPAHVNGDLGFLIPVGQLPQMAGIGADADHAADPQLLPKRVLHAVGSLANLLHVVRRLEGLDNDNVRLIDVQDEILLLVREKPSDHFHRGHIGIIHLANQQHDPGLVGDEVQLLGADIHVAGQNVIGNDVLDEGGLVVLFLEIVFRLVEGNGGHRADRAGNSVSSLHKRRVIQLGILHCQGTEAAVFRGNRAVCLLQVIGVEVIQTRADHGKLTGRNHKALIVYNTDGTVNRILHLNNHILEYSAGHSTSSFTRRFPAFWLKCQRLARGFLSFYSKRS